MEQDAERDGGQPIPEAGTAFRYAGFWRRFAANFLDGIVLNIMTWILVLAVPQDYWLPSVIGAAYVIGFWIAKGQTPGKMALGVRIITTSGEPIGAGRAVGRYFAYFVSFIALGIGYLMIAFDDKKQGLHDKIAGTYVIET